MTISSQERVRSIALVLTFRDVAENLVLPMAQYADHSRRAQLLIQMVDGYEMREERTHRYRSVFGASAMRSEEMVTALESDPIIGGNYEIRYIPQGSEQRDDLVTMVYSPPANTAL